MSSSHSHAQREILSQSLPSSATSAGWQIAGFHGRSGTEIDKIGFIYTPNDVLNNHCQQWKTPIG